MHMKTHTLGCQVCVFGMRGMCVGQRVDAQRSGWSSYQSNVSSQRTLRLQMAIKTHIRTRTCTQTRLRVNTQSDGCNQNKNLEEDAYNIFLATLHKQKRRREVQTPPPAL